MKFFIRTFALSLFASTNVFALPQLNESIVNYEYTREWTQGAVKKMKEWGCFK